MTTYILEELTPDELAVLERYRKERDSDNEYTPWISEGITEIQYYHRLYLEMSNENARLTAECEAAHELLCCVPTTDDAFGNVYTVGFDTALVAYQLARAARVQAAAPGTGEA